MLAWQNAPRSQLELAGLRLGGTAEAPGRVQQSGSSDAATDVGAGTAKFDLLLSLAERGGQVRGSLEYATALFDRATVERYIGYLRRALEQMAADDDLLVTSLALVSESERAQVEAWNATAMVSTERCVHELFEAQAARTPDAVALVYEDEQVSYGALDARADRLASVLEAQGVTVDQPVGIYLERSLEQAVAVLAILKAGGTYVPLDPSYPPERLARVLADAAPALVVTHAALAGREPPFPGRYVALDGEAMAGGWAAPPRRRRGESRLRALHVGVDGRT
jgi:non-ribosomal peptide synthetase component F